MFQSEEYQELERLCAMIHGVNVERTYKEKVKARIRELILKLADIADLDPPFSWLAKEALFGSDQELDNFVNSLSDLEGHKVLENTNEARDMARWVEELTSHK